jgi:hypothetical protein
MLYYRLPFALLSVWAVLLAVPAAAQVPQPPFVDTPPCQPPADAIVLFDGCRTDAFVNTQGQPCHWPVLDGTMEVRPGFIVSKVHFRDVQIHVEFAILDDGKTGGWAGNSGIYIHGQYELQILKSHGNPVTPKETVGAVYGIKPPLVNAGRALCQWQVYDIIYTAPRRDDHGKITAPGAITAILNGVLVQHNTHFMESVSRWNPLVYKTTPYTDQIRESLEKTGCGPLFLQDHGSPVRFRNVWIRPLDDKAKAFEAK